MVGPIDTYLVLGSRSNAEIKEKGSRFAAFAIPVSSVAEAEIELAAIKKRDYDATHHCSAFRIGIQGSEFRYSDDGEPSSSAGLPIFRQLEGRSLTNALVVVVRYYGGTKLGTGGLVRAYGEAASLALNLAKIDEIILRTKVEIEFAYDDTSGAMHVVQQFDSVIGGTNYSETTRMTLAVRTTQVEAFERAYVEVLSGRGTIQVMA